MLSLWPRSISRRAEETLLTRDQDLTTREPPRTAHSRIESAHLKSCNFPSITRVLQCLMRNNVFLTW